jgi:hypothetical protein
MQFSHDPSSFLLGPNVLLNTLLSETLSLGSSHKVWGPFLHPYNTIGKITVLYILIFNFLYEMEGQKVLDWMLASIPSIYSTHDFIISIILIC